MPPTPEWRYGRSQPPYEFERAFSRRYPLTIPTAYTENTLLSVEILFSEFTLGLKFDRFKVERSQHGTEHSLPFIIADEIGRLSEQRRAMSRPEQAQCPSKRCI